jgi:hypothetical protein
MMRGAAHWLWGAVLVAMAGCSANRYCAKPQDYEYAPSVPPIASTDNLTIASSPDAFTIPPAPATPVPFGQKVSDPAKPGETRWSCLDQPPPLPPSAARANAAPAASK